MSGHFRRAAFVALLSAFSLAGVSWAVPVSSARTIQPGDYIESSGIGCTLGFVADGKHPVTGDAATYVMTAAHCVEKVGKPVSDLSRRVFGDVVARGNPDEAEEDWALILVRPSSERLVKPEVRGIAKSPNGVATWDETAPFDTLRISGYGIPWFPSEDLRETRYGVLSFQDKEVYEAVAMDTNGDSGGPIVHEPSGQALGLVSRLCIGSCTSAGPTVQGIVAKAAKKGFDIELRLAPKYRS